MLEWSLMSTLRLFLNHDNVRVESHVYPQTVFTTKKIQLSVLVLYKVDIIIIISLNVTCFCHNISEKLLIWC